jgi:hypothetical protein
VSSAQKSLKSPIIILHFLVFFATLEWLDASTFVQLNNFQSENKIASETGRILCIEESRMLKPKREVQTDKDQPEKADDK